MVVQLYVTLLPWSGHLWDIMYVWFILTHFSRGHTIGSVNYSMSAFFSCLNKKRIPGIVLFNNVNTNGKFRLAYILLIYLKAPFYREICWKTDS